MVMSLLAGDCHSGSSELSRRVCEFSDKGVAQVLDSAIFAACIKFCVNESYWELGSYCMFTGAGLGKGWLVVGAGVRKLRGSWPMELIPCGM